MRLLHTSEEPISAGKIEETLGQSSGRACHHLRVLRIRGLVDLVAADDDIETFYASRVKDRAAITVFLEQDVD
jgi:DNA-binding transcriptional ArsR family regulator